MAASPSVRSKPFDILPKGSAQLTLEGTPKCLDITEPDTCGNACGGHAGTEQVPGEAYT